VVLCGCTLRATGPDWRWSSRPGDNDEDRVIAALSDDQEIAFAAQSEPGSSGNRDDVLNASGVFPARHTR